MLTVYVIFALLTLFGLFKLSKLDKIDRLPSAPLHLPKINNKTKANGSQLVDDGKSKVTKNRGRNIEARKS